MAGTNNDLPEGTDTIITGAGTTSDSTPGRSGTGVQGGSTSQQGNATGARTAVTGSASADSSTGLITPRSEGATGSTGGESGDSSGGVRGMLSNASTKVREQAGTKARSFVGQGLESGSTTLTNLSQIVNDTVSQIEEKLGPQYGEYARTASQTLDRYAQSLSSKDPDELVDDVRDFVRKSPGVALGAAAVVGFSLVRLLKAGIEDNQSSSGRNSTRSSRNQDI